MKCHICSSESKKMDDLQFKVAYYYCPNCEFIQMDGAKHISLEEEKEVYELHNNSIEDEGYVNFFKKFIDQGLSPYLKTGKILDYGSGPVPVLSEVMMRDYDYQVAIYDKFYQPNEIYKGEIYDGIVSTEVIEHIARPMEAMALWVELLEKGGVISIMTLLHKNDQAHFLDWWYRRDWTHISFFTEITFKYIAKVLNLDFVYCDQNRICTFIKK